MGLYILIFFIVFIVVLCFRFRNYKIKLSSFTKKGVKVRDSRFGVYCYDGKQGCGKTQNAVHFILDNCSDEWPVYANLRSLKGINYYYFNGIDALLSLRDKKHCIIFYDEIFTILMKGSKFNNDILVSSSARGNREYHY